MPEATQTVGRQVKYVTKSLIALGIWLSKHLSFSIGAAPVASRSKSSDLKCHAPISNQNWMLVPAVGAQLKRSGSCRCRLLLELEMVGGHDDRNSSSMFEIATLTYLLWISVFTASGPCISAGISRLSQSCSPVLHLTTLISRWHMYIYIFIIHMYIYIYVYTCIFYYILILKDPPISQSDLNLLRGFDPSIYLDGTTSQRWPGRFQCGECWIVSGFPIWKPMETNGNQWKPSWKRLLNLVEVALKNRSVDTASHLFYFTRTSSKLILILHSRCIGGFSQCQHWAYSLFCQQDLVFATIMLRFHIC